MYVSGATHKCSPAISWVRGKEGSCILEQVGGFWNTAAMGGRFDSVELFGRYERVFAVRADLLLTRHYDQLVSAGFLAFGGVGANHDFCSCLSCHSVFSFVC